MKNSILITATIFAYCILATAICFSQGTAINKTGAQAHNSALLDLSDTTKGILIPRMKKVNKLAIASPATGLMIYQTDDTTGFWYFNSVKWVQAIGPAGSGAVAAHYPGELYQGGVVFWVDQTGNHGLICSMVDINTFYAWSDLTTTLIGAAAQSDWDGQSNSNAIIAQSLLTSAADLCDAYINLDYGTGQYSDWYLPSRDELNDLWNNIKAVRKALDTDGNAATTVITRNNYWSSTEYSSTQALVFNFGSGSFSNVNKANTIYVRAIRAF